MPKNLKVNPPLIEIGNSALANIGQHLNGRILSGRAWGWVQRGKILGNPVFFYSHYSHENPPQNGTEFPSLE